jgi:hypothetical protein
LYLALKYVEYDERLRGSVSGLATAGWIIAVVSG